MRMKQMTKPGEPTMVCITFRGAKKADVEAHFEQVGIPLYEIDKPRKDMICLKKYVFEDHPTDYIKFLFDQLDVWDISYTAWRLAAWEEQFGSVKEVAIDQEKKQDRDQAA